MKPLASLAVALLLTSVLCASASGHGQWYQQPASSRASPNGLARSKRGPLSSSFISWNFCALNGSGEQQCTDPAKQLCGVNRTTGEAAGCVSASQCPSGVTSYKVTCDATSAYCCCKDLREDLANCNNLRNDHIDEQWKQACSLRELNDTAICNKTWIIPVTSYDCIATDASDKQTSEPCTDLENHACGIDRLTGIPSGCVKRSDCPANVAGQKVVCDPGRPYCCCDTVDFHNCNDIKNENDDYVRRQACSLVELSGTITCRQGSYTTKPPIPLNLLKCLKQDAQGGKLEEECTSPGKTYCGIDLKSGASPMPIGCVASSECPKKHFWVHDMECDSGSLYCCCKPAPYSLCNDIENEREDYVWQQACRFPALKNSRSCIQSWTTTSTTTTTTPRPPSPPPPPPPPPIKECMHYDSSGKGRVKKCGTGRSYCGISLTLDGTPYGCVNKQECLRVPSGSKVECNPGSNYCCCEPDPTKALHCNDIYSKTDDSVWQQACTVSPLDQTSACKRTGTPTTPPPPPPPPPNITISAETMPKPCLNFCMENVPAGETGPFKLLCGLQESFKQTRHCPQSQAPSNNSSKPCPSGCDDYCLDGSNLHCPKLSKPTTSPSPSSSKPPEEEKKFFGLSIYVLAGIGGGVLAVLILCCLCCCCCSKKKVQPGQQGSTQPTRMWADSEDPDDDEFTSSSMSTSGSTLHHSSSSSVQVVTQPYYQ